jgi:Ca-activated chloride channel family protein
VKAEVLPAPGTDPDPANNTLTRTFAVQAPLRLLYLGDRVQGAAARLGDLLGRGFTVQDGSALALDPGPDLGAYDLVLVDDRPASRLPEAFQARLAAAVRQNGLGLLFSGGKASFGTGGYDRSTLAEALPVDFIQRTEKRDPSTSLAVIIDTSGSMMGTRIELAKQITRLAIRRLKAHDRVGIVEFYGNKHWALPLQSAANKIAVDRAIGRMQATGGTVMYPAMEEAYYGLKNVNTRYKHILIITDAGVEDADYESLVRLMTRDNVNVSTVLVGAGAHSQSLIDIASWGRGRFYSASDRYNLPEVVLKQSTTMNLPAYKTGGFPLLGRGGAGWWGEVDRTTVPALQGYVETQARTGAEVLLEVEGAAHPVLASWQYGVGRVTALMTEPLGEGTVEWKNWSAYGRWLARIASRTAGDTRPFRFEVAREDHQVAVEARRYADRAGLAPRATLLDAQGRESGTLEFRQLTPGHFRAETVVAPTQELRLAAGAAAATGEASPAPGSQFLVSSPAEDVAAERQVDPAAGLDLAALAQATGGTYTDASRATVFAPGPVPRPDPASLTLRELWPYAALLALLVYLAEIVYRRWPRAQGVAKPATA